MSGPWLTWNVRGLGGTTKRGAVKKAVLQARPEILMLQETNLNEQRQQFVSSWMQELIMSHVEVHAVGSAGGLMCLWRENFIQVQKNRIATKENLGHRGVALEDERVCVFCLS